jgi:hypothetical protein
MQKQDVGFLALYKKVKISIPSYLKKKRKRKQNIISNVPIVTNANFVALRKFVVSKIRTL